MWEGLFRAPLGRTLQRKLGLVFTALSAAVFAQLLFVSTPVFAEDASWQGSDIVYQNNIYTKCASSAECGNVQFADGVSYYSYKQPPVAPSTIGKAYIVYFTSGVDPPKATSANIVDYDMNGTAFINPGTPKTISIAPTPTTGPASQANTEEGFVSSSCSITTGISWIVCPVMKTLAEGMDYIYGVISSFLKVQPIFANNNSPIYRTWVIMRDLANILFVIGFLALIYAQITGGMLTNYTIKKMVPRIVVAALAVNVSYHLCAVGVDISNILGASINGIFENIRDTVLPGSNTGAAGGDSSISWSSITTLALGAGAAGVGVHAANGAVLEGALGGIWYIIAPLLLGALLVVIVTFLILAARQAIITILIIVSPLAFVAYLLPNTEQWFDRWRKTFFTMLLMFPAFGAVFGGAQLAGQVIIRSASGETAIAQQILGLAVQAAPLFITPLLIKLSGGVLNRFAGVVNDRQKGLYDRYKNYNKERLAEHQARNQRKNAEMWANGDFKRRNVFRRHARRQYAKRTHRAEKREQNEARAKALYQDDEQGVKRYRDMARDRVRGTTTAGRYRHATADTMKRDTEAIHADTEKRHEEHWRQHMDPEIRQRLTSTHTAAGRAKLLEDQMNAEDEQSFRQEVDASAALTRIVKDTHHAKQQATKFEEIVQKAAEKSWNDRVRNDADTRSLHIKAVRNEDNAKVAEQQVKTLVEEVRTQGGDHAALTDPSDMLIADAIKKAHLDHDASSQAEKAAQRKQTYQIAKEYRDDASLRERAAGIGGETAEILVEAQAKSTMFEHFGKDVKAAKTLHSRTDETEILDRMRDPSSLTSENFAAMAGIIASRGNRKKHIEVLKLLSDQYDMAAATGDSDLLDKVRDAQQQFSDDKSVVPFGFSASDHGNLGRGEYTSNVFRQTKARISTHLSPETMASMSPDDFALIYEMDAKGILSDAEHNKVVAMYDAWQNDEQYSGKIKDKDRNIFERIKHRRYTGANGVNNLPPPNLDPNAEGFGLDPSDF